MIGYIMDVGDLMGTHVNCNVNETNNLVLFSNIQRMKQKYRHLRYKKVTLVERNKSTKKY